MNHQLSLDVLDTLNPKIFRVVDITVYNENLIIDFPTLDITLPGFSTSVRFDETLIVPKAISNFNACNLQIQTNQCDSAPLDLPDGIYVIRYSVSPNDIVYVEYNHLRVSILMNTYFRHLCDIPLAEVEPNNDVVDRLEELQKIRSYIDAAKAKVEIAHEPTKGMDLYNYAKKLLDKFDCVSCY